MNGTFGIGTLKKSITLDTVKNVAIRLREAYVSGLYKKLQTQKASILDIAKHYNAVNIRLFGSVLRGEEREDSDIDLLVDFLPGSTLLDQVGLVHALSAKLGHKVDIVSERALNKHLRQRVLQEAVAL